MKTIDYIESLELDNPLYIDVRSPGEFSMDHIPGSINIPLFDDNERVEVGTLYRMAGKEKAMLRGSEIVGTKLQQILSRIMEYRDKNIIVSCARGGMRSGSLASLLDSLGFTVFQLNRGYKGYRKYIIDSFNTLNPEIPLIVLQGLTGSGKTEIIRRMENSIDLEKLAGHRSSVFGGIGIKQNTQKSFETGIISSLHHLHTFNHIIIEGESQKIGNLHIPDPFYTIMKQSPAILIKTPLEMRIDIIEKEYSDFTLGDNIPEIVKSLRTKLGKKIVDELLFHFNNGNIRKFIEIMLLHYYDPLYAYSLEKKHYIDTVDFTTTDETLHEIEAVINAL
jgi:tRNA 2-selenouridine synthase